MADRETISPTLVEKEGPGVGLSSSPSGIPVEMSDPDPGLAYARNRVTLTCDLLGWNGVRLNFKARELGDGSHAPPPSPFPDDTDFDGMAVSADGVD